MGIGGSTSAASLAAAARTPPSLVPGPAPRARSPSTSSSAQIGVGALPQGASESAYDPPYAPYTHAPAHYARPASLAAFQVHGASADYGAAAAPCGMGTNTYAYAATGLSSSLSGARKALLAPSSSTTPIPTAADAVNKITSAATGEARGSQGNGQPRKKNHACWMCHKSFDRPSTLRKFQPPK
ncbi:hypothetical protein EW145_g8360 [Phellinidium pouzarii]|uniref:Uncharacterized protein n=1 Tax=Phellinidium pouzarii TaxID=167371 RepID=A0A4S4K6S3_9AGAM|nr:hypothetical protein EW145_g8360 [Phellinidium pouzarii]